MAFRSLLTFLILFGQPEYVFAEKAHQHGLANVGIILDGKAVLVELKTPADSIIGFEHAPRNKKEQEQVAKATKKLKTGGESMFLFAPELKCKVAQTNVHLSEEMNSEHHHGHAHNGNSHSKHGAEHADVRAEYRFHCGKKLDGSNIRFAISKAFPKIRQVKVRIITESKQFAKTIINDQGTVKF